MMLFLIANAEVLVVETETRCCTEAGNWVVVRLGIKVFPMKLEDEELLFLPRRRCAANPSSVSLINTLLLLRCTSWEQGQEITGVLEWVSGTATTPGNRTEFIASLLI
jgi:hypothetical protein